MKTALLFSLLLNSLLLSQSYPPSFISQERPKTQLSTKYLQLKSYFSLNDFNSSQDFTLIKSQTYNSFEEVSRKSPWLAFGLSYLFPGLGQVYNGEYWKALIFSGTAIAGAALAFASIMGSNDSFDEAPASFWIGVAIGGGAYLWSLIDAPISASKINEKNRVSGIKIFSIDNNKLVIKFRNVLNKGTYYLSTSLSF